MKEVSKLSLLNWLNIWKMELKHKSQNVKYKIVSIFYQGNYMLNKFIKNI
jgi:hypothetical protein